jgi:hypothetical protein
MVGSTLVHRVTGRTAGMVEEMVADVSTVRAGDMIAVVE